jgi:hypothetical protein
MQVFKLPDKGKTHRFEVHDEGHRYDVVDSRQNGRYTWSCTCGRPDCLHVAAAKRKFFGQKKEVAYPAESGLVERGGFRPFVEV